MPVKEWSPGATTEGKFSVKSSTNIATVNSGSAGNTPSDNTFFAMASKSGSNYIFRRGIFIIDFRQGQGNNSGLPRGLGKIQIHRAELILSDCVVASVDTGGDKLVVSQIVDPHSFGSWHANDYSKARMDNHCSAQTITNGADNAVYVLDNRVLLNNLEDVINRHNSPLARIHLATRNNIDFFGGTPSCNNSIRFDDFDDNAPLKIRIYFGVRASRRHMKGGGSRASKSGFQGTHMSAGTSGGFG